jgi:ribosomal-protein-alanine N-acetyltransferase
MSVSAAGTIAIRPAGARDLPSIVAIERASFADPWTTDAFESAMAMHRMSLLVAEERAEEGGGGGATLVGYVVALHLGVEGEIADLAVAPRARRKGIAGLLLDRVVDGVFHDGTDVLKDVLVARGLWQGDA